MNPQTATALLTILVLAGNVSAVDPIVDLTIHRVPTDASDPPPHDWYYSPTELNLRTGSAMDFGPYMFAGLKRSSTGDYVTVLDFQAYSTEQTSLPADRQGWEWSNVNINESDAAGVAGTNDFVYMFWKLRTTGIPDAIRHLGFIVTELNPPAAPSGYTLINVDLNPGNSPNVFAYYTTDQPTVAANPATTPIVVANAKSVECCGGSN